MANEIRNARKHLERVGDKSSERNTKTRLAAFKIVVAICENYPSPKTAEKIVAEYGVWYANLPRGYSIVRTYRSREFSFPPTSHISNYVFRDGENIGLTWHKRNIRNATGDLAGANLLAADIHRGFLGSIYQQIKGESGQESAEKFWFAVCV
jgi:hypothetical protein